MSTVSIGRCQHIVVYGGNVTNVQQTLFLYQITTSLLKKKREAGAHAPLCYNYTKFMTLFVDENFQSIYEIILSTCVRFLNLTKYGFIKIMKKEGMVKQCCQIT